VAPLPEWGTETLAAAEAALATLGALLDCEDPQQLSACLEAAGLSREGLPATLAGIELACLDLMARRQGVSLASLLSGAPLPEVTVNALLTAIDPVELAAEARARVAQGFGTLKLKVGLGAIAEDVRRVRAVREAVGPAIRLRADANAAWDVPAALTALKQLQPFDLEYLEQPVPEARDLSLLRDRGLVAIAADESAHDAVAVGALLAQQAVDWLILKPMALGGLLYTQGVARDALRAGIGVTLTSVLDRGIGTAGALHLAAALGMETACGLSNTHMDAAHFVGPSPEAGTLAIRSPGHGVSRLPSFEVAHDA
jgi:o-succinylbenzoate synthase